jgi:NADPH2:quinone reductase
MNMHAMILDKELNFSWREMPDPVRKADEVLIKVHAAAINRADLMQKDGCYSSPEGWPQWCGLEVSGEVMEAPSSAAVKPGDKVCALLGGGGYSELVTVPAGMVIPIPEGLSMIEAASLPEVWATVYLNLQMEAGGMKPGDVFYMQAGASGVGLAAIQFAKQMGATVITTVDSPEKAEFVRKLGADFVLDYRTEDVRPVIAAHPPTVALDCIGGKLMGECFRNMVFGGRWIMIATMGGSETTINLETVWRKRIRLIGSTLRSRTPEEKSAILQALQQKLWPLFTARKLVTNIHAVFPIHEVIQAHDVLRRCENIGKVVLTF